MKPRLKAVRQLLPVFLALLLLFEIGAFATTITPPSEKYLQLYVLGFGGAANNYYPNGSSSFRVGESISWHLGVVNDMGLVQLVAVRVKLGNQSIETPNDTLATPSPAPLITEFKSFVQDNETWDIPFEWQVTNYTTQSGGQIGTLTLMIDNMTYSIQNPPSCLTSSCSFRLIFELWTWNVELSDFQIGWWNGGQQRIAWLQLWFNLAPSGRK